MSAYVQWYGEEVFARIEKNSLDASERAGEIVLKSAQDSMPFNPEPSFPSEPPLSKTGELKESGSVVRNQSSVDVVFEAPYAMYLELGTRKMAPRPFLRPALVKNADKIEKEYEDLI